MNKTLIFVGSAAAALTLVFAGCGSDSEKTGGVTSCALNKSDTLPYLCTEVNQTFCSINADACKCEATAPSTASKGGGCDDGWTGKCAMPMNSGGMYYYNATEVSTATMKEECEKAGGSWSDGATPKADGSDTTDGTDKTDSTDATDKADGTDATDKADGTDATDKADGTDATDKADSADNADAVDDGSDSTDAQTN